ncbi:MAG TPA: tetratricopeptide repeat protein [Pyrinomonadaceae bacterium]|nr:tetratricopeptide repeat protein [Pyrinomonadaceae bacterium]
MPDKQNPQTQTVRTRAPRSADAPRRMMTAAVIAVVFASLSVVAARAQSAAASSTPAATDAVRERRAVTKADAKESAAKESGAKGPEVKKPEAKQSDAGEPETKAAAGEGEAVEVESEKSSGAESLEEKIQGAKTDAERARLRRSLAEGLAAEGRRADAVAQLRELAAEERFDPAHFYNVGNALARLGESSAAVEVYRKAVAQKRGHYSRAQHNLGVVLMRLGRWEEAREALASAVRLEGGVYPEASYNLGRLHDLRGEAGLAIAEWTRALAGKPDHADAAAALARALAEDGDPERGLQVLDAFTKRAEGRGKPAPREIAVARGEIVAAMNLAREESKGGRGVAASEASFAAGPRGRAGALRSFAVDQQTYDLLRRARAARESERDEEAAALFRRVISSRGGYFPPANLELGYALISLRRDEEAAAALAPVAERDGARYPVVFYHMGRLYERLGQLRRSSESFARASALYGDANPQMLVELSRISEKEGDLRAAVAAMERYVGVSERAGDNSAWARERLARLREKLSAADAREK